MADRSGRRRVFQSYRRLDERAGADNPYPTIVAATQAIEARGARSDDEPIEALRPMAVATNLKPPPSLDPYFIYDEIVKAERPRIPAQGMPETHYIFRNGKRVDVRAKGEFDTTYPDGTPARAAHLDTSLYPGADFAVHAHAKGPASHLPGPGDWEIPQKFGIPLYGRTEAGTFRVDPPDRSGHLSVKLVEGRWGGSARDVERAIEQLNLKQYDLERSRPSKRRAGR